MKSLVPSGWSFIGPIKDAIAPSLCQAGTVVCDPSFLRNSFKLVSLDEGQDTQKNIAWVNGWRVLIQGSSSSDENNIIVLQDPPTIGTRVDFIFLEVWRKLIYPSDTIYKHGNVLYGGTNYSNDLIDPAMGIETSLRIQLQYRIRVASADIESYPDGFDPNLVFVQGPLPEPITTCSHAYFSPVEGDPGLWYAGAGDDVAQETLGTVDGHTYAIPMFAVRRRNTSAYTPDTRSNGASRSLADYVAGFASDRPDNLYNDWIVAEDILDMRHKVISQENVKELCENAFSKLVNNRLPGKMTKSSLGEDSYGITLVHPDAISYIDRPGSTRIAQGDGIRRIFSNAQLDQPESFSVRTVAQKIAGTPNIPWASGDAVQINLSGYPAGTQIVGLKEVYTKQVGVLAPSQYSATALPTSTLTITLGASAVVLGTAYPLTFEYTLRFPSGSNGLTHVPNLFLECRREDSTSSIAMMDQDIRVRNSYPIGTTDGTKFPMLMNRGGSITEPYDFGHQMIYHAVGNGTQIFTVPRSINGYTILGLISIKVGGALRVNPQITRNSTTYTIDVGSPIIDIGRDIEVVLYTQNKIFDANKQGRAITNCWEMLELIPDETADGGRQIFHIDSQDKAILALSSYAGDNGAGFVYVNGTRKVLETKNTQFPYDSTKTYGTIEFSAPDTPAPGATIEVPTFLHSAISPTEGYTFFYKTLPYQGLLDSSTTGVIEASGPAITTTSGSGTITDYTYSLGMARLTDTTVVYGFNTEWASNVKAGQYIRANSDATREYGIKEVYNNTTLFINAVPDKTSAPSGEAYSIIAKDQPAFLQRNIIDLLPALSSLKDSSGRNSSISTAVSDVYPVIETRTVSRVQDIEALPEGTVWIGLNVADRGRSSIHISSEDLAPLGLGNLGLKFEKLSTSTSYKKTFKSYIMNKNNSGQLFLLVVGSETDNTSASCFFSQTSNSDSVDIFELPGRPLVVRRIV
jgi:hypothetical protein